MKLVTDKGRWVTKNNEMIFSNVVWLTEKKDAYLYHLIDDNNNNIILEKPIIDYIIEEN